MEMNFKQFCEANAEYKYDKTVAFVPGSMKPPTAGHLDMIKKYSKTADEVIVIITNPKTEKAIRYTSAGHAITAEISKEILEIYIKAKGLKNVKVVISQEKSPLSDIMRMSIEDLKNVNVVIGTSKKGNDANRYKGVDTFVLKKNPDLNFIDIPSTAVTPVGDISASFIRDNIEDKEHVLKYLPRALSDSDKEKVYNLIKGK